MKKRTLKETKERIQSLLDSNHQAAVDALLFVYDRQTVMEKKVQGVIMDNGIGFTAFDGEILSSFAQQWNRKKWLSDKQLVILHRKIRHYWKQLSDLFSPLLDKEEETPFPDFNEAEFMTSRNEFIEA